MTPGMKGLRCSHKTLVRTIRRHQCSFVLLAARRATTYQTLDPIPLWSAGTPATLQIKLQPSPFVQGISISWTTTPPCTKETLKSHTNALILEIAYQCWAFEASSLGTGRNVSNLQNKIAKERLTAQAITLGFALAVVIVDFDFD